MYGKLVACDPLRAERDARAVIAADLHDNARGWDAKADQAARDGRHVLSASCRSNAAELRDRASSLLENCP
jgi:hypothetical protein